MSGLNTAMGPQERGRAQFASALQAGSSILEVGAPAFLHGDTDDGVSHWVGLADAAGIFGGVVVKQVPVGDKKASALQTAGVCVARVKAASGCVPGAWLMPSGGAKSTTAGHFELSAAPTGIELLTDLSSATATTIYGPDVLYSAAAPEIRIHPGALHGHYVWTNPAALSATAVLAAYTDDGAEAVITTGFTAPDVPRCISATAGGTAGDIGAIQVIVVGTDMYGNVITETLPIFVENTAATKTGNKAFATVTQVTIPAHDGTGATTSIGYGDKLGLPRKHNAQLIRRGTLDNTLEGTAATLATSASAIESNTVILNSALDATQVDLWLEEN